MVVRDFADGRYPFYLGPPEVRELQRLTDAGPLELYRRLLAGGWRIEDVTESIRLGLVGAARKGQKAELYSGESVLVTPALAGSLVQTYVSTYGAPFVAEGEEPAQGQLRPWADSSLLAAMIVEAGLLGVKDEPLGAKKKPIEEEAGLPFRTENSGGDQSSPPSPTEA